MALNQVSEVPAGVLRVISCVILTYTRTFSNREPIPFSKAHALSYTHSKVGNDQMHIRGEMTSGKWTLSGFVRSRPESLWWFEVDFWPLSVHFRRGPPPFSESTCPQVCQGWFQMDFKWILLLLWTVKLEHRSEVQNSENGLGYLDNITTFWYTFDEKLCGDVKISLLTKNQGSSDFTSDMEISLQSCQ